MPAKRKEYDVVEFKRRWDRGDSMAEIGLWVGCSHITVSAIAKRHGLKRVATGRFKAIKFDDAAFVRMWNEGAPLSDMIKAFGCSNSTLYRRQRDLGLPPRDRVSTSTIDIAELKLRWDRGDSMDALSEWCGREKSNIYKVVKSAGLKSRAVNRFENVNRKKFARMWNDGAPLSLMCSTFNYTTWSIGRIAARFGLEKRTGRVSVVHWRFSQMDRSAILAVWVKGLSLRDTAAALDVKFSQINRLAAYFDLPPHKFRPKRANPEAGEKQAMRADKLPPKRLSVRGAPMMAGAQKAAKYKPTAFGRWDGARDEIVRDTGGRYACVARAAKELGETEACVRQRWHQLRAGVRVTAESMRAQA